MKPVPEAVVNRFANHHPSPDDRKTVVGLVAQLMAQPDLGIPIPFEQEKYKDCYVAFTPDGHWRVVYRRINPEGIVVVSIDPEES